MSAKIKLHYLNGCIFLFLSLFAFVAQAEETTVSPQPIKPTNDICLGCHASNEPMTGTALLKGSVHKDFACIDCHSDIKEAEHTNTPGKVDCSSCHSDIQAEFEKSIHFQLASKGQKGLPTCTNCHGTHGILAKLDSTKECGQCHQARLSTYTDTFHGKATTLKFESVAKCSDCHTAHQPLPASDPGSSVNHVNLTKTCGHCHAQITSNFIQYDPHADPNDSHKSKLIYFTYLFMQFLLISCFAFWGAHTFLWFQRSLVAIIRREFHVDQSCKQYILRFTRLNRALHVIIVSSFLGLVMTGIPIKFSHTAWAKIVVLIFGNLQNMRHFHRAFGVITICYFIFHLLHLAYRLIISKHNWLLSGPKSMIPRFKDFIDLWDNLKWFFYKGERPKYDRWTYFEKFDYFAVFWGVCIIGLSGLILWFPAVFTRLFPGEFLNVAAIVHSEEALLAMIFIFTIHFFHNHMRPENFPIDLSIFSGVVLLDKFKEERPEEYKRLVEQGDLEKYLVPPPSKSSIIKCLIFGYTTLGLGLALNILILVTLFLH